MKRRQFLQTTGTFISATALLSVYSKTGCASSLKEDNSELRRDNYDDFETPLLKSIVIGLNAPSAHNTQAWKFYIVNENEMMLYVDETRLLPQTDPPSRQIHISCGCFLEALSIGCSGIGYKAEITLLPEGEYTLNEIGKKPVALVKLLKDDNPSKHILYNSIFTRRTNRTMYEGEIISRNELSQINNDCQTLNSKTTFINSLPEMEKFKSIFSRAMEKEYYTLAANEETRKMFRFTMQEAETRRDGLTFESNGFKGSALFFARTFTKNTKEGWNKKSIIEKGIEKFNKGLDSSKAFVIWTTISNNLIDQINVGRDFYQFSLALTKNGYALHPLNQAEQEYNEMDEIRLELDKLMSVKEEEKIQMILRIGRAAKAFESFRRHLDSFIKK